MQSSRWQQLADLSEPEFERRAAQVREGQRAPGTSARKRLRRRLRPLGQSWRPMYPTPSPATPTPF
jgi:hypothetical protein